MSTEKCEVEPTVHKSGFFSYYSDVGAPFFGTEYHNCVLRHPMLCGDSILLVSTVLPFIIVSGDGKHFLTYIGTKFVELFPVNEKTNR